MTDFLGNTLQEGDSVVFTRGGPTMSRGIFIGTNRAFAKVKVSANYEVNVVPKNIIKI